MFQRLRFLFFKFYNEISANQSYCIQYKLVSLYFALNENFLMAAGLIICLKKSSVLSAEIYYFIRLLAFFSKTEIASSEHFLIISLMPLAYSGGRDCIL